MAYNQYNQGGYTQGGYAQQNPYGQSANPYGQTGNPYGQTQGNAYAQPQNGYGQDGNYSERPDLEHHSSSRYDEEAQTGSYEMSNMNGRDADRILNEVRNLDRAVDQSEMELQQLERLQTAYLSAPDPTPEMERQMKDLREKIMDEFRVYVGRVRRLKQDPESDSPRNRAQVGKIDRRVKAAINQMQKVDRSYRDGEKAAFARRYRIVRPEASEAEVQEALETGAGQQIFSQAILSANRRGDAQTVATKVQNRHAAIQQIEKDMMDLAQLFNDLEALVVQQEPAVAQIEEKGQEAAGHVAQANTELDGAVKKARSARRKKWMCLGLVILIIIIIVVVVVVVVEVTKH